RLRRVAPSRDRDYKFSRCDRLAVERPHSECEKTELGHSARVCRCGVRLLVGCTTGCSRTGRWNWPKWVTTTTSPSADACGESNTCRKCNYLLRSESWRRPETTTTTPNAAIGVRRETPLPTPTPSHEKYAFHSFRTGSS